MSTRLVLASASPQRRELLGRAGVAFDVRPTGVDELEHGDPAAVALENARRKALAGGRGRSQSGEIVLAADTLVALDGDILGKPRDEAHAREHLSRLQGRTHEVHGGVAIAEHGELTTTFTETTRVTFAALDAQRLEWYLATGEWRGRAGGYAIQGAGAAIVARIDGDYANVVGLPLAGLLQRRPDLLTARVQGLGAPGPSVHSRIG